MAAAFFTAERHWKEETPVIKKVFAEKLVQVITLAQYSFVSSATTAPPQSLGFVPPPTMKNSVQWNQADPSHLGGIGGKGGK